jgi:hypothetical protein
LRLAQSHQKALRIKILELREPWVHRVLALGLSQPALSRSILKRV